MLKIKSALFLFFFFLVAAPGHSHRVEPIRFDLATSGPSAQENVLVTNTRSFPITIEAVVNRLEIDANGKESLVPAEDDFLIFPPQAVIEPGKTQTFRVRYIGDPTITRSVAYRIGINQLPIDMSGAEGGGIALTLNFATLVNVVPKGARSKLEVAGVERRDDGRWGLVVNNSGTRYARLNKSEVVVRQGERESRFKGEDIRDWFSSNIVLPGESLGVTIPAVEGFDPHEVSIELVTSG